MLTVQNNAPAVLELAGVQRQCAAGRGRARPGSTWTLTVGEVVDGRGGRVGCVGSVTVAADLFDAAVGGGCWRGGWCGCWRRWRPTRGCGCTRWRCWVRRSGRRWWRGGTTPRRRCRAVTVAGVVRGAGGGGARMRWRWSAGGVVVVWGAGCGGRTGWRGCWWRGGWGPESVVAVVLERCAGAGGGDAGGAEGGGGVPAGGSGVPGRAGGVHAGRRGPGGVVAGAGALGVLAGPAGAGVVPGDAPWPLSWPLPGRRPGRDGPRRVAAARPSGVCDLHLGVDRAAQGCGGHPRRVGGPGRGPPGTRAWARGTGCQFASAGFDAFGWEWCMALLSGAALVMSRRTSGWAPRWPAFGPRWGHPRHAAPGGAGRRGRSRRRRGADRDRRPVRLPAGGGDPAGPTGPGDDNSYGPTETTVGCDLGPPAHRRRRPVPIGTPGGQHPGVRAGRVAGAGAGGRGGRAVCRRGAGLARGYPAGRG